MIASATENQATAMNYTVTTFCSGPKYEAILPHWRRRVKERCPTAAIAVFSDRDVGGDVSRHEWGWSDRVRLEQILARLAASGNPVIQCDLDVVVESDLAPLVGLDFNLILSADPDGFPRECSAKVGVGACTGFYILRPTGVPFVVRLLADMKNRRFGSCADQVALMNHLATAGVAPSFATMQLAGREYRNATFRVEGVSICVLDNGIVTRDPVRNTGQFANHVNCENVGGVRQMIRYFYEHLDDLQLTCRCGQLGDTRICAHLRNERDVREAWARGVTGWRRTARRLWLMLRHPNDRW